WPDRVPNLRNQYTDSIRNLRVADAHSDPILRDQIVLGVIVNGHSVEPIAADHVPGFIGEAADHVVAGAYDQDSVERVAEANLTGLVGTDVVAGDNISRRWVGNRWPVRRNGFGLDSNSIGQLTAGDHVAFRLRRSADGISRGTNGNTVGF